MNEKTVTNLDVELARLKNDIISMMDLVAHQLEKSELAFVNHDIAVAKEIHHVEKRVDAADLSLDKECENIIALYNPVASDLRFVLASLKIISHLERVGDHADKIARYVRKKQIKSPYPDNILTDVKLSTMFDLAEEMLEISTRGFIEEDGDLSREVFARDTTLNELYSAALKSMNDLSNKEIKSVSLLYLFSVVNKLERVGDLAKNIAEETIFYLEAKVLKHHKVKKIENL